MGGPREDIVRRSRWMLRALEWDDTRAKYPNIWHNGMPKHLLAVDRIARRLRLGDLIAVYSPASERHTARSERFVGLSRVAGLRAGHRDGHAWIDLETEHRFRKPLDLGTQPRRVFLCCDPGWPGDETAIFGQVVAAARKDGWSSALSEVDAASEKRATPPAPTVPAAEKPTQVPTDRESSAESSSRSATGSATDAPAGAEGTDEARTKSAVGRAAIETTSPSPVSKTPVGPSRRFGGVDYSGDMRDPREATWLAVVELRGTRLQVGRLEATARAGLERNLRDADRDLARVEAIGLDFPFSLPLPFAEHLLGGPFPEDGWWALAKRFEHMSRPEYLVAVQEYREREGEPKRATDEIAGAFSPLHRVNPDLGPMTYHGIRMIAEDRSRFAIRPFETASGRLLLEVYPGAFTRSLHLERQKLPRGGRVRAILDALVATDELPVDMDEKTQSACLGRRDALDAVLAARAAARAVVTGEAERTAEALMPGQGERLRHEGWIYGV